MWFDILHKILAGKVQDMITTRQLLIVSRKQLRPIKVNSRNITSLLSN